MNLAELPVIKQILDSGAEDRVYDSLVLGGPVIIAVILLVGRSVVTIGLALLYIALFVSYLAYQGFN